MKHKLLRIGQVTRDILIILSRASAATLDILFDTPLGHHQKQRGKKQYLNKKLHTLIGEGYVEKENRDATYRLTDKGRAYLWKIKERGISRNKKWDHKWRVVCFDIQERSRTKRDLLRRELKYIGFIQLQQSVWIYPFACEGYIELLQSHYLFGKNVRYMIVEKISNDQALRKHFKLIS